MQTSLSNTISTAPAVLSNLSVSTDVMPSALLKHAPDLPATRQRLFNHPLYQKVDTVENLRRFMEDHVFAVWDFMSLTKRLQRDLTSVSLPWQPPRDPSMARFINEIVLGEESDVGQNGVPVSHLELYLAAMEEVGADTSRFDRFAASMGAGSTAQSALISAEVPAHVRNFVLRTLDCALHGETIEVIACFLYGREDVIPIMFERLLGTWNGRDHQVPSFAYYLQRHIELDGDDHGPAARRMLERYADGNDDQWRRAGEAAAHAIQSRIQLWDGVQAAMTTM